MNFEWLRSRKAFLVTTRILMAFTFAGWMAMLNNFAIEKAAFTGAEIGMLQSLREIPGFMAFTAVFLLLVISEQTLALVSLCLLSIGVALTGLFPFEIGLYATTVLMSIGFHYFETVNNSLSLQWLSKQEAPAVLGQLISVGSLASLIAYGAIWLFFSVVMISFSSAYLIFGGIGFVLFLWLWLGFPKFDSPVQQNKKLIIRKRYWLYYLLTFFSGARRQIFMVFAGFMMVEKFGYDASDIALLYIANHLLNLYLAPKIGHWIGRIGERKALTFEYIGLIVVFVSYGLVQDAHVAAALYIIDHIFFAMAIAIKTFFQKIADPADIASSSGVSFTINHIAAVVIPASFGIIWLVNPSMVFYAGALMAFVSLVLSQLVDSELKSKTALVNS
ncbi:MFS transporter [Aliikangiella coralliicola]|uniref:MFS transporter n=1 Tax=Aliikangiella coralliicola TaxID=2592383 RepID=A0A545U007_9GAMM|nr:MFS transporter [Aliikangiella coralliicola]TQV82794.1 MFS transporter [Aliikangiella coralliicola]